LAVTRRFVGADDGELGADVDGVALLDEDLGEVAGLRRRHLGVDLVGRDLEERLVLADLVADRLEPLGDRPLGDGLTELGHGDVGHYPCSPLPLKLSMLSPKLSESVGCGWMRCATSGTVASQFTASQPSMNSSVAHGTLSYSTGTASSPRSWFMTRMPSA